VIDAPFDELFERHPVARLGALDEGDSPRRIGSANRAADTGVVARGDRGRAGRLGRARRRPSPQHLVLASHPAPRCPVHHLSQRPYLV
jgi:hypothetical protein